MLIFKNTKYLLKCIKKEIICLANFEPLILGIGAGLSLAVLMFILALLFKSSFILTWMIPSAVVVCFLTTFNKRIHDFFTKDLENDISKE